MIRSLSTFTLAVVAVFPASGRDITHVKLIDAFTDTFGFVTRRGLNITIHPRLIIRHGEEEPPNEGDTTYKVNLEVTKERRSEVFVYRERNNIQIPMTQTQKDAFSLRLDHVELLKLWREKKLRLFSTYASLDPLYYIHNQRGIFSFRQIRSGFYQVDLEDMSPSKPFISEIELEGMYTMIADKAFKLRIVFDLGHSPILLPKDVYESYSAHLKKNGFKKEDNRYQMNCMKMRKKGYFWAGKFSIVMYTNDEHPQISFFTTLYDLIVERENENLCIVDIAESPAADTITLGSTFLNGNSVTIDTMDELKKYKLTSRRGLSDVGELDFILNVPSKLTKKKKTKFGWIRMMRQTVKGIRCSASSLLENE